MDGNARVSNVTVRVLFLLLVTLPWPVTAPASVSPLSVAPPSLSPSLWRSEREFFLLAADDRQLKLAHQFVKASSVILTLGGHEWRSGVNFRVREREGVIIPLIPWCGNDAEQVLAVVEYEFQPLDVAPTRDLHLLVGPPGPSATDSTAADVMSASAVGPAAMPADLVVHGSKMVRVSSGNRREMAVDQNLRLTINGHLTDDIAVQAILSDDNLPVVPEGTTEELRDVDKVLVQLQGPQWSATLGDFVAERDGFVFGGYRRKLQGFQVDVEPGDSRISGLAGSPRGAIRTLQIRGEEANQGPYFLDQTSGGGNLFVVAGSERVTLDAEELRRGSDNDYTIDYVRGAITFTYRRLITAESEIVVEFEEGEGAYARSVVGGGGGAIFQLPFAGSAPGEISVQLVQEKDNPDRLRSGELSADDVSVLAAAGDDETLAVADGVQEVEAGTGEFSREEYEGGYIYNWDHGGDYNVTFFYVGQGHGDYGVDSLTVSGATAYGYRGSTLGSYRIGRPLPAPASHSLVTVAAGLGTRDGAGLFMEWDLSQEDRNLLSTDDDENNRGGALAMDVSTGEMSLKAGDLSCGRILLSGRHMNRSGRFRPFLLDRNRYSYDKWGLAGRARREDFLDETDVESQITAGWDLGGQRRRLRLEGQWGRLGHGDDLTADRWRATGSWQLAGGDGRSFWAGARSRDSADPLDIRRRENLHEIGWMIAGVRPSLRYGGDEWIDDEDTEGAAGYRRTFWASEIRRRATAGGATWRVGFERAIVDSSLSDTWREQRDTRTTTCEAATGRWLGMRLNTNATLRDIRAPQLAGQQTRLLRADLNTRWREIGSEWTLAYRIDSSRAEVMDRQVVWRGERQADYNEDGDFVGHNLGAYDIVYAGSDSLVATTGVEATLNWRQDYAFLGRDSFRGAWSTSTLLSTRARSRTDEVGDLLRLEAGRIFDPKDTVLGEVDLQQEVRLLRHVRWIDLNLRFDFKKALDRRYVAHPEERLRRRWRSNLTWSISTLSTLHLRLTNTDEMRASAESAVSARNSYDSLTRELELEYALRMGQGSRLALAFEQVARRDGVSGVSQDEWAVHPDLRWRVRKRWSIESDLRYSKVESANPFGSLQPYFYPLAGTNVEASTRIAWDPSRVITVSMVYFARLRGFEGGWQHDVRVESTARF